MIYYEMTWTISLEYEAACTAFETAQAAEAEQLRSPDQNYRLARAYVRQFIKQGTYDARDTSSGSLAAFLAWMERHPGFNSARHDRLALRRLRAIELQQERRMRRPVVLSDRQRAALVRPTWRREIGCSKCGAL